ncbi:MULTISPECIES: creatininase family protein [Thermomonospora]|uniref:Creatininase n=1 Tax=Thermomonospora curvata (strain ATCC 19995 / DSM 43183 / JCM 3096 / KCTC 9072 / NBRC 15933 / NCIMB 10081 / Henssen B9) TaxID=471852 RepID=D1A602_THECD|nr:MULTISPECIES: creatininase family protein [Thermomonospora]ACY98297.1 Creatininase [Thermomonospora curvata DSM 43183]PKK13465.1 MAG: creatininase [Thermomonospora sp. CIF 1]
MNDSAHEAFLPLSTSAEEGERRAAVALLPVGSFEQHGPYLPLATDTVVACTIAGALAAAYRVLRLPPITISCSHEHEGWPGTVSISAATLHALVGDVAASLRRAGIGKLVVVNGHGGNYVLGNVVQEANAAAGEPVMALFPGPQEWESAMAAAGVQTSAWSDMHAGELETSLLLHAHPHLVRPGYEAGDHLCDDRRHLLTLGMAGHTRSGVVGRPSLASARKGEKVLGHLVELFADCLAVLGGPDGQEGTGS